MRASSSHPPDLPDRSGGLRSGKQRLALVLLVAAFSLLPYLGTLNHGFVWDDHELIENNSALLEHPVPSLLRPFALGTEKSLYYRPVVILSLALDHALWGMNPRGYHLTNLVIYALSAIGLFLLLLGPVSWHAAALAAALFGTHPAHVESVAFVSGRSDLLAGLLLIGALLMLKGAISASRGGRIVLLALAAPCYLLSLLAKESSGYLPFFALAVLWMLRRDPAARRVALGLTLPVLAGFVVYLALRFAAFQGTSVSYSASLSVFPIRDYPWFLLQALRLLLVPYQTLPYYEPAGPGFGTVAALVLAIGLFATFFRWLSERRARDIIASGSTAWLLLALVPMLPLFRQSGSIIADRFLYVPTLGLAAVIAAAIDPLFARLREGRRRQLLAILLCAAAALGVLTGIRAREWRSDLALYESAARRNPGSVVLNYLLGWEYLEQKRYDDAERSLKRSLEAAPDFVRAQVSLGDVHRSRGEAREAERRYRQALSTKPGDSEAAFGLGVIEMDRGNAAAARALFLLALREDPGLAAAHMNLGIISYQEGDHASAELSWRKTLELQPDNTFVMNNLGVLAQTRGDVAAARELFQRALAVEPGYANARRNLENLDRRARP